MTFLLGESGKFYTTIFYAGLAISVVTAMFIGHFLGRWVTSQNHKFIFKPWSHWKADRWVSVIALLHGAMIGATLFRGGFTWVTFNQAFFVTICFSLVLSVLFDRRLPIGVIGAGFLFSALIMVLDAPFLIEWDWALVNGLCLALGFYVYQEMLAVDRPSLKRNFLLTPLDYLFLVWIPFVFRLPNILSFTLFTVLGLEALRRWQPSFFSWISQRTGSVALAMSAIVLLCQFIYFDHWGIVVQNYVLEEWLWFMSPLDGY